METLYTILFLLGTIVFAYLMGSIPFGILIGKKHGIDIREHGSGNAGGTNVGRTLGKKNGILCMVLDILKSYVTLWVIFILITYTGLGSVLLTSAYEFQTELYIAIAGFLVCIGHTFPIFAQFKGGKAVACFAGYVLFVSPILFAFGFGLFMALFVWKHRISICSIIAAPSVFLVSAVPMILHYALNMNVTQFNGGMYFGPNCLLHLCYITFINIFLCVMIVIIRHKSNIKRIHDHEEPETHFQNTVDNN